MPSTAYEIHVTLLRQADQVISFASAITKLEKHKDSAETFFTSRDALMSSFKAPPANPELHTSWTARCSWEKQIFASQSPAVQVLADAYRLRANDFLQALHAEWAPLYPVAPSAEPIPLTITAARELAATPPPVDSDPLVFYIVVRTTLSPGKVAAQTAHAGRYLVKAYYEHFLKTGFAPGTDRWSVYQDWEKTGQITVILAATSEQFQELSKNDDCCVVVVDAGRNEVAPGTQTALGFYPMRKSKVPKMFKRLQSYRGISS
jgi:peptidyl-tRNA hydrolase